MVAKLSFSFASLWDIVKDNSSIIPNYSFCVRNSGVNYQPYALRDVYDRVVLWKFPLLQLITQMQRPPLGFKAQAFVIFHLLGDPIDTIWSLLYKLKTVQIHANSFEDLSESRALALIASSYDEWDEGEEVKDTLLEVFESTEMEKSEKAKEACLKAAASLAADRATAFIPVLTSEFIFVLVLYIALIKAASTPEGDNRTSHNIAFAALYFWVIPAVLLSSFIGVSQSRNAIPRILKQFEDELSAIDEDRPISLPQIYRLAKNRLHSGGIYTWQVNKYRGIYHGPSKKFLACSALFSCVAVWIGFGTAFALSWRTPPEGLGCRGVAHLSFLSTWMFSWLFDWIFARMIGPRNDGLLLSLVMIKDFLLTTAEITTLSFSSMGVFNRCLCWTNFGTSPLNFPQDSKVALLLKSRIQLEWKIWTSFGIGLELVVLLVASIYLSSGLWVLLQRDKHNNMPEQEEY